MPRSHLNLPPSPGTATGDVRTLKLVLPFLWPRGDAFLRRRMVLAVASLGLAALLNALVPILFGAAVDALKGGAAAAVAVPVALILAYGTVQWLAKVFNELRWALYGPIEQRVQRNLGLAVFRHLHELSLRFHLARRTGALSRTLDNGMHGIKELLFDCIFLIFPLIAEIVFIVAVLLYRYEGLFAAIVLGTLTFYTVTLIVGSEWVRQHQRRAVHEAVEAHGQAIDSLLNYETVKYFGNEGHIAERYDHALRSVERLTVRALTWRSLTGVGQVTILGVGMTLMVLLAAANAADGTMTLGDFVLVNAYLLQLIRPLDRVGNLYRAIKQELLDLELMLRLFEEEAEVADAPDARPLPPGPGRVVFEDVSFAYDARRPVLADVSFTAEPGRTVAFVGPSGAGKSTVGRLLFRFYDATRGRVRIDGEDVRRITQASLRAAIAVVPQDCVLFNDTIFYNIAFGQPEAGRDEVIHAARLAQIHDFIAAQPDGYDTLVGERGLKLSGGEKQRVAIARAVLKRPRIFLFDEATSALDSHTERAIQQSLREVSAGTTTLIIAHRLSTVVHADEIVVMDDGRVVERGTHAELLARDGRYAALWARQREEPERA